jgi:hypothetical protein
VKIINATLEIPIGRPHMVTMNGLLWTILYAPGKILGFASATPLNWTSDKETPVMWCDGGGVYL